MKSSYLTNIILLLIALALLWLLQRPQDNPDIPAIAPQVSMHNIENIIIKRHQQDTITLQNTGQTWQLVQPIKAAASDKRVKMLFELLTTNATEQFALTNAMNAADFGLAEPEISLQFDDIMLKFGDSESLSGERYILRDDQIYLVEENISQLLKASASGFIENHMFARNGTLKSLSLPYQHGQKLQNQSLLLQRQDDQWQTASSDFSSAQLSTLANNWQKAAAIQVSTVTASAGEDFLPLVFRFDNSQILQAYARLSPQGLSVLFPERQLQYQFPASTANSLFPARPINSETD